MINFRYLAGVAFAAAMAFAFSIIYVLVLDADGGNAAARTAANQAAEAADRTNCDEIYGTAYRSKEERDWFSANCSLWSKAVGDVPDSTVAPPPAQGGGTPATQPSTPPPAGRDCNQIRGTPYRSDAERAWYLANCMGAPAPQPGQPATATTDRSDCNQIRGTPYQSETERQWYTVNCLGQQQQTTAGPDRTNCDEIRGTPYRSETERRWYQANCNRR